VSGANEGVGSRRGWIMVNDETREGQHESSIVHRGIYLIRLPCIRGVVRGGLGSDWDGRVAGTVSSVR
jgi:hypothetical protein